MIKNFFTLAKRFRTSKGFGVHSPLAFRLIKELIRERLPYYDYDRVKGKLPRLLYRLGAGYSTLPAVFYGDPESDLLTALRLSDTRRDIMVNPEGGIPAEALVVYATETAGPRIPEEGVLFSVSAEFLAEFLASKDSGFLSFSTGDALITVLRRDLPGQNYRLL